MIAATLIPAMAVLILCGLILCAGEAIADLNGDR